MSQYKLTIITVNLNNCAGLERTLSSIAEQNDLKPEVIVIDGGSTDGSLDVIFDFKKKGIIDYYQSEKDGGIYYAMNIGITFASGNYIQFLNSGDTYFENRSLKCIYSNLIDSDIDIFYSDFIELESGDAVEYPSQIDRKFLFFDMLCHQGIIYKKSVFEKIGFFDTAFRVIADKDHLYKCYMGNCFFKHIDKPLILFERAGYSSSNVNVYSNEIDRFRKMNYSGVENLFLKIFKKFEILVRY